MSQPDAEPAIGVLISGRGSNLQALIDAVADGLLPRDNRAGHFQSSLKPPGFDARERAGIETLVLEHRAFPDRGRLRYAVARQRVASARAWRLSASPVSCG